MDGPMVLFYNAVENTNGGHIDSAGHHSWVITHEGEPVGDWRGTEAHSRGADGEPF